MAKPSSRSPRPPTFPTPNSGIRSKPSPPGDSLTSSPDPARRSGRLFVISGPSGVGKGLGHRRSQKARQTLPLHRHRHDTRHAPGRDKRHRLHLPDQRRVPPHDRAERPARMGRGLRQPLRSSQIPGHRRAKPWPGRDHEDRRPRERQPSRNSARTPC